MSSARHPLVRRLAWATDVHLNFLAGGGLEAFAEAILREEAQAVLLTGDIAEAPTLEPLLSLLAAEVKLPIYFVLGNHDYYRSSVPRVREVVRALCRRSPWLIWLPDAGVVPLAADVALIGVDGWSDGRNGDFAGSPVMINDYMLIAELVGLTREGRLARLHQLGDAEGERLEALLGEALEHYPRVIVATHVPPFVEACWHEGQISNQDWLPHFTCRATGDVLRKAAEGRPERAIRVLCGHTHGAGTAQILPNLKVVTGGAEYGEPRVQSVIDPGKD